MNTTFKTFDPEDDIDKYYITRIGATIQLVEISSKRVIDYLLLDEILDKLSIHPAWMFRDITLMTTPMFDMGMKFYEFIDKHNNMISKMSPEQISKLFTPKSYK